MSEQEPNTPDEQVFTEEKQAPELTAENLAPGNDKPEAIKPGELTKPLQSGADPLDLDYILDIPLQVRVEVGRTRLLIQELLQLGKGSVIELNKLLGEPFEMLVNDKLVARGEVVVVNDRFGLRLTDIISPNERVQSLA